MHLFVIPDGNRRWERAQGWPLGSGHLAGYATLKQVLPDIWDTGVSHFTFWALARANKMKRDKNEMALLTDLFHTGVVELGENLISGKDKVRFRVVGDTAFNFPIKTLRKIEELERATAQYTERHFTILVMYDFEWDLLTAVSLLQRTRQKTGEPDWESIRKVLPSGFLPDVDLMFRSGHDPHLSGAALAIQMANAELHFAEKMWPDVTIQDLEKVIADFRTRERRFGA